jgi:protein O-mannosyl-transferase
MEVPYFRGRVQHVVNNRLVQYLSQGLKTIGRSVLPPEDDSQRMVVWFCIATIVVGLLHYLLFRKMRKTATEGYRYLQLATAFFIAILIPVLFGVSTRTTEGDRLLYFPACFLCMMLGFLLLVLVRKNSYRWGIITLLVVGAVYLTVANNKRWVQASDLVKEVQEKIQQANGKQIVLINLPEELEGAFVFRNGFYNSLLVYGIDTAHVTVSHYLKRTEYLTIKDTIPAKKENGRLFIYPATYVIDNQDGSIGVRGAQNEYLATVKKSDNIIYYWNNRELVKLF